MASFESIAGYESEKEELKRLCHILNNREFYTARGAKLPKGVIFYGAAGNGKTLFAKVLADECELKVFKIDLGKVEYESEICKIVSKTFSKAQQAGEPAMIFFDEIDKALPDVTCNYCTDRSKTVLSQLLTLIDGMDSKSDIVFVATCNDYFSIPESLTRPGRIDKKIAVGAPSLKSRVEILEMYFKKSSCLTEIALEEIAELTAGMSCAALETLVNECILSSDENCHVSRELVLSKIHEIKNEDIPRPRSSVTDTVIACRNIGAFLVARSYNRGNYTLSLDRDTVCNDFFNKVLSEFDDDYGGEFDDDDDDYYDDYYEECNYSDRASYFCKADLVNAITVRIAGLAAEEMVLNKIYDNTTWDVKLVNKVAIGMANSGMFGLDMFFDAERHRALPYTVDKIKKLNEIIDSLIADGYSTAKEILAPNIELIKKLVPLLVDKKAIPKKDLEPILKQYTEIKQDD